MSLFRRKTKEQQDEEQIKKTAEIKIDKKTSQPKTGPPLAEKQKPKKKEIAKKGQPTKERKSQVAHQVLIHPLITEKSNIQSSLNQYVFMVGNRANKVEIKKAIEEIYHIKPSQVRIINVLGKMVRTGRRGQTSRQKNWKKAIVTIPAGKKIDVYEGV